MLIYGLRAGLFGTAGRLLARRLTSPQAAEFHSLTACMDAAGAGPDLEVRYPLNVPFDAAIVTGTRKPVLTKTYFGAASHLHLFRPRGLVQGGGFEGSSPDHGAIVAALDASDLRVAFEKGWAHVQAAKSRIVASGGGPPAP